MKISNIGILFIVCIVCVAVVQAKYVDARGTQAPAIEGNSDTIQSQQTKYLKDVQAQIDIDLGKIEYVNATSTARVTLETPWNYPENNWASTFAFFDGESAVCTQQANYPVRSAMKYQRDIVVNIPEGPGEYNFSIELFSDDDCEGSSLAKKSISLKLGKSRNCINCNQKPSSDVKTTTTLENLENSQEQTEKRAKKQKLDLLIETYRNDPDFSDILFLIQLFIALNIIEV